MLTRPPKLTSPVVVSTPIVPKLLPKLLPKLPSRIASPIMPIITNAELNLENEEQNRRCMICHQNKAMSEYNEYGSRKRRICKTCDDKALPIGRKATLTQLMEQANAQSGEIQALEQSLNTVSRQNETLLRQATETHTQLVGFGRIVNTVVQQNHELVTAMGELGDNFNARLDHIEQTQEAQSVETLDIIKNMMLELTTLRAYADENRNQTQITNQQLDGVVSRLDPIINALGELQAQQVDFRRELGEVVEEAYSSVGPSPAISPRTTLITQSLSRTPSGVLSPESPGIFSPVAPGGKTPTSGRGKTTVHRTASQLASMSLDELIKGAGSGCLACW